MPTIVNSWNEWDPLVEVIIGRADGACVPPKEPAYMVKSEGRVAQPDFSGPHDHESIRAAAKQQDNLCKVLSNLGTYIASHWHGQDAAWHAIRAAAWS